MTIVAIDGYHPELIIKILIVDRSSPLPAAGTKWRTISSVTRWCLDSTPW
jgi:hypothetical protein